MKAIVILLLLAGCAVTSGNETPTPAPVATSQYPIVITVIPRAIGTINVHEAICRTRYTLYLLWPNLFEIKRDTPGYLRCLLEGI